MLNLYEAIEYKKLYQNLFEIGSLHYSMIGNSFNTVVLMVEQDNNYFNWAFHFNKADNLADIRNCSRGRISFLRSYINMNEKGWGVC